MYHHAPENYDCPFCHLIQGGTTSSSNQNDIVYRDSEVTAFLASSNWPNNRGHVLVVPNQHYENVYDLPAHLGTPIQHAIQTIALAFKATYGCHGVSTRQHNELQGNQDVWHYHVHVFPRYKRDWLNLTRKRATTASERAPYAEKLRGFLGTVKDMPA